MSSPMFQGFENFDHGKSAQVGVLLLNLGTPDAPTKQAVRPYLREFLGDKRVIEYPRLLWWLILNGIILNTRPAKSAKLYKKIWQPEGSPLLVNTRKQAELLQKRFQDGGLDWVKVAFGMRYGNPSIESALEELRAAHVRALLVLPLYPQYSGTTTGSTFDGVVSTLTKWRWVPDFRMVMQYHDEPLYIEALARSVERLWQKQDRAQKLLLTFHGIPRRYVEGGDPYYCQCQKTARLLAQRLKLSSDQYMVTFQSLFGREEWLRPYTAETMEALAKQGVESVDVMCPGFSSDCLETLEEIDQENRQIFLEHGGKKFSYIPALNNNDDFIDVLIELTKRNLSAFLGGSLPEASVLQNQAQTCQRHYAQVAGK